ncbi:hypothetical protein E2C01_052938 [Portunus trituberculatus]|uniref:Uncharacterized protein n=1 Tax=Portunus trituberculatus TaxID=210409 RepID=A0A5B7GN47_PORTR|nr:hypothetical protein [Portunus trituberculatus]
MSMVSKFSLPRQVGYRALREGVRGEAWRGQALLLSGGEGSRWRTGVTRAREISEPCTATKVRVPRVGGVTMVTREAP